MTSPTLLAAAAFAFAAASLYAFVGWRLGQRPASEASREAVRQFGYWWLGLAGVTVLGGLATLMAAAGVLTLELLLTSTLVSLLVLVFALRGLLHHLVYVFTGRDALRALTVFYACCYAVLVYFVVAQDPASVDQGAWTATLAYGEAIRGPLYAAVLALVIFPQLGGAVAYMTLLTRTRERTQRYRIALVSVSIIVWFGSSFLANAGGLGQEDWWQAASRALGLGAALAMLVAYFPPGWMRRRYGLRSLAEEHAAAAVALAPAAPPAAPPPRREFRGPAPTALRAAFSAWAAWAERAAGRARA